MCYNINNKRGENMAKVLLVEDNESIIKGLKYSLITEGFTVDTASNITVAKSKLKNADIVILDITLPDGNGFEFCKYIKNQIDIPVIFLTAKDEEEDVVKGLELGADDYVIKPFRTKELISRINRTLKSYKKENKNIIKCQNITIDINSNRVFKNQNEIILTSLEYKILLMLFTNIDKVVTREDILSQIWDMSGKFVNDNTLTVYIKRIRTKLDSDIIKTIKSIGYRVDSQ